jgi:hypothetical protein
MIRQKYLVLLILAGIIISFQILANENKYCISCGKQILVTAKFCPFCGSDQKSLQSDAAKPDESSPQQEAGMTVVERKKIELSKKIFPYCHGNTYEGPYFFSTANQIYCEGFNGLNRRYFQMIDIATGEVTAFKERPSVINDSFASLAVTNENGTLAEFQLADESSGDSRIILLPKNAQLPRGIMLMKIGIRKIYTTIAGQPKSVSDQMMKFVIGEGQIAFWNGSKSVLIINDDKHLTLIRFSE